MNKLLIFPILILILLSLGIASANDNITDDISLNEEITLQNENESIEIPENEHSQIEVQQSIKIETKDIKTYYKEDAELVGYLKDSNNKPISNKKVSILINNKIYNKLTDKNGKIVLKINFAPGTYKATIKFEGDENYTGKIANAIVKINKAPLKISTHNYKTYWHSDLFFKAKIINKITKNPVKGIKVAFKVLMANNKHKIYYSTTNSKGIASLKKNLKVGSYKVISSIKNKNTKSKNSQAALTVKATKEYGCCSFYVQVSNSEAVSGFRRDGTNSVSIHIKKCKWNGRTAVKQYKTNSYFFHTIVTSDGWMIGTGGIDNAKINKAIENLAGKMVKKGKITKSYLKKIQKYERSLGLGHFSIKSPNGKYGLVWGRAIYQGKLKAGEFLSVPNGMSSFRHGTWAKFSDNPKDAAIKVAATDPYGINRRGIDVFHWKLTTKEGKSTSMVKVYASNDNAKLLSRSSCAHLKDNIYFSKKFISKNKLPKTPSSLYLGKFNFGNIDKLIKTFTTVKVAKLTKSVNESKTFDITVKNKKTKKIIPNLRLNIKILNKVYTVKTNSKGIAKFDTRNLDIGSYNLKIYSANNRYYVSAKSTIKII